MGIRFRCHHCESELHVKDFQAGKRGRCPECKGKFRIPLADADHSLSIDRDLSTGATVDDQPGTGQTAISVSVAPSSVATSSLPASQVKSALPHQLSEAMDAKWFVRPTSGGQYGPTGGDSMWQWLQENRIGRDSLVWREGWPEWLVAEDVFSDYFTDVQDTDAASRPSPATDRAPLNAASEKAITAASALQPITHDSPTSLSERNRANRRQKRRRNYTVMIAILSLVMIGLIVALAVVLSAQQGA